MTQIKQQQEKAWPQKNGGFKERQETSQCRLCSCLALALSVQALPRRLPALLLPGPRRRGGSSINAKKEVPVSIPALFLMPTVQMPAPALQQ